MKECGRLNNLNHPGGCRVPPLRACVATPCLSITRRRLTAHVAEWRTYSRLRSIVGATCLPTNLKCLAVTGGDALNAWLRHCAIVACFEGHRTVQPCGVEVDLIVRQQRGI